jgi:hypothetical protein
MTLQKPCALIARGELGLDPLYIANEGKMIAVGATEIADAVVAGLRKYPNGRDACVIGEVKARPRGMVVLETAFGGARIVDMLMGEQGQEFVSANERMTERHVVTTLVVTAESVSANEKK